MECDKIPLLSELSCNLSRFWYWLNWAPGSAFLLFSFLFLCDLKKLGKEQFGNALVGLFFWKKNWTPLNSTFFQLKKLNNRGLLHNFFSGEKQRENRAFLIKMEIEPGTKKKTIPWSTSLTQIVVAVLYKSRQIIEESSALMPNGFYCWAEPSSKNHIYHCSPPGIPPSSKHHAKNSEDDGKIATICLGQTTNLLCSDYSRSSLRMEPSKSKIGSGVKDSQGLQMDSTFHLVK